MSSSTTFNAIDLSILCIGLSIWAIYTALHVKYAYLDEYASKYEMHPYAVRYRFTLIVLMFTYSVPVMARVAGRPDMVTGVAVTFAIGMTSFFVMLFGANNPSRLRRIVTCGKRR